MLWPSKDKLIRGFRDALRAGRLKRRQRKSSTLVEHLEDRTLLAAAPFPEFVDPNPNPGNQFGDVIIPLSTGNVVITSPYDDAGGTDAGAVYLFDGATGALISALTGASDFDYVGRNGVVDLGNGNFVVPSPDWDNGGIADAGAVTFGSGVTGVNGPVSTANSLYGLTAYDYVGTDGVTVLGSGNYLVRSSIWDDGATPNAGAVTFGSGTTGIVGAVSDSNSLIGASADDQVGNLNIFQLDNGNYLVSSPNWDNGAASDAGAVTFGDGTTGIAGVVSSGNSLVGSSTGDQVGGGSGALGILAPLMLYPSNGIVELSNGNYLVLSTIWDNAGTADAGAVTFGSGTTGVSGVIDSTNSLVGGSVGDQIGYRIDELTNGNYLVSSPNWDNGGATDAGAVTFGNGMTGVSGVVDPSNSLVGSSTNDRVGNNTITALSNGNYVVATTNWSDGGTASVGAVTFGNGTIGVVGVISSTNSLIGSNAYDNVGIFGVHELATGNYVVQSPYWDNDQGAVTFGDGNTGVMGVIDSSNSLVGGTNDDLVGYYFTELTNGNYVVQSPYWQGNGYRSGAVTFGSGLTGVVGIVDSSNSLVGSQANDQVGQSGTIRPLNTGNYVVASRTWDDGGTSDVGAVTFGNGTTGVTGTIDSSNSLIGSSQSDQVGSQVIALANGNYIVRSPDWDNGSASNAGAVTFGDGNTGVMGVVDSSNSLVGVLAFDRIGNGGVTQLSTGNILVGSRDWNGGRGAVTFMDGSTGLTGTVDASTSLVGSATSDRVGNGGIFVLSNGNYLVRSPQWNSSRGAVTFGDGNTGVMGTVSSSNSLVGSSSYDQVGNRIEELANGNFVVGSYQWNSSRGAATFGDGATGVTGVVSAANSLVGSTYGDQIGGGIATLSNGHYLVVAPGWNNGPVEDAGAVTFGNGTTGITGVVSANNSLVGTSSNDNVGYGISTYEIGDSELANGNYIVRSPYWDNGSSFDAGAVTWGDGTTGISGPVSAFNSLVGLQTLAGLGAVKIDDNNGTFYAPFTDEDNGKVRVRSQSAETFGDPDAPFVDGTGGDDQFHISRDGADVVIMRNDIEVVRQPIAGMTSITINGGLGDDELTIDFTNDLTVPIIFDGQGQSTTAGDSLVLMGGSSFTDAIYNYDNANDGSIQLTGQGTITYTGLEPIISSIDAVNVTLNYSDGADDIAVSNAGSGQTTVDSSLGELTTFTNPTGTLTINAGDVGKNTITINSLSASYPADITINGGDGKDTVAIAGAISFANDQDLLVNAHIIDVTGNINVAGTGTIDLLASRNVKVRSGATLSSVNGDITLTGNGAGTTEGAFIGIDLDDGHVTTSGSGAITLTGIGGVDVATTGLFGVYLHNGATVSSTNGGSAGNITVTGTGGSGSTVNHGVAVAGSSTGITSVAGDITITGTGGLGAGDHNDGVFIGLDGVVQIGTGVLTVTGTALSSNSSGVRLHETTGGKLTSTSSGSILVTATGSGTAADLLTGADSVIGGASATGNITIQADQINLSGATLVQSTGDLVIEPRTSNTSIGLGGATGTLQLSDAEINLLHDGFNSITIGDAVSGTGTINVDTVTFLDPVILAGGEIHDHSGLDMTAPEVTFHGVVAPGQSPGILNVDGDVVFGNGSSLSAEIGIPDFDQISVLGTVTIGTDVDLNLLAWNGFSPVNGSFVIVDNDAADAVMGTFKDLPEGTLIQDFLGSGRTFQITYVGGDGNDIVLEHVERMPADIVGRLNGDWWVAESNGTNSLTNDYYGSWGDLAWEDTQTGDFNGDGLTDIASRLNGLWYVGISDGDVFTQEVWGGWDSSITWLDVNVADVDGDGDSDIIGRTDTGGWWVARSNGVNGFTNESWGYWVPTANWQNVMVADVDGDGKDDIIGRESNGNWWVAHSNGINGFTNEYWGYWVSSANWMNVMVADVDGDGDSDVVGRMDTGGWWVARSNGTNGFVNESWGYWDPAAGWQNVLVADVDGDGNDDIVGRESNGNFWVAHSDGSSFSNEYWGYWVDTAGWQDVLIADVNQDGNADVVGRTSGGDIWVAKSNGVDGFTNELWGNWSPGTWKDVAAFSSGSTIPAPATTYVPNLASNDDEESIFT